MGRMSLTQEELSTTVGKSRSTVANTMRLLSLSPRVQEMVSGGILAPGSARALVTVDDENLQQSLARKISSEGLSARKAEELVKHALTEKAKVTSPPKPRSPFIENIRVDFQRALGTEVKISDGGHGKGKIEIEYYSQDDLVRILEVIKGEADI
jgi:ParB family chromosome partitioning protein